VSNAESKNSQNVNHPKASIEHSSLQLQQQAMRQKENQKETHKIKKHKAKTIHLPWMSELFPLFINKNVKP
jgi:hypothetical protein